MQLWAIFRTDQEGDGVGDSPWSSDQQRHKKLSGPLQGKERTGPWRGCRRYGSSSNTHHDAVKLLLQLASPKTYYMYVCSPVYRSAIPRLSYYLLIDWLVGMTRTKRQLGRAWEEIYLRSGDATPRDFIVTRPTLIWWNGCGNFSHEAR